MGQDATAPGVSKPKHRAWLGNIGLVGGACVLGVVVGSLVGRYISAALGFPVPPLPPGVPASLYDGTIYGGIYGGIGACLGALVTVSLSLGNRWLSLGISLLAGALFAAVGAGFLER